MSKEDQESPGKLSLEGIECVSLDRFAEEAYLNYSMNVIRDRALPSVTDGMKPVQRRIVYAMEKLGIGPREKHVKSARTVGEVLGKYHPHGDTACYEAMVIMAQPFSYRYPLIDGQGNWGDTEDPKSFAAMRYTESRLSPFSGVLLDDLNQGCVEMIPNFDGTTTEPKALPARLPNILLNGTMGIAVGMATSIPPHNLTELANAAAHLIDHPEATVDELMNFVKAPDYPGGALITSTPEELRNIYATGLGFVRQRAIWHEEKDGIVITALPHQVSGGQVVREIADLMAKKLLPQVQDVLNTSDSRNPCRILIVPRSGRVDAGELMNTLFARTSLEGRYGVNLNILGLDGNPAVKNLPTILSEWLNFRFTTVRRRLEHRLGQVRDRLMRLAALMIVFLNIDEVIRIIREEDEPKPVLMQTFSLNEVQADYILETKLRQLARLEEMNIRREQEKLTALLGSETRLKNFVKREIQSDARIYGDERRCPLEPAAAAVASDPQDDQPGTPATVVVSRMGWVRQASGFDVNAEQMSYRSGDGFQCMARGRTNEQVVFLSDHGRAYSLYIRDLPSARGQGTPLSSQLNFEDGELVVHALCAPAETLIILATDRGYGFMCRFSDLPTRMKNGHAVVTMDEGSRLLTPVTVTDPEHDLMVVASRQGRLLIYPVSELPVMAHGKGLKLMNIPGPRLADGSDGIAAVAAVPLGASITILCGKRTMRLGYADLSAAVSARIRTGNALPRGFQKVDGITVTEAAAVREVEFTLQ